MPSDETNLSSPVRVILGDGFCDFQRGLLGGTPVVIDSLGRTYTAGNLADFVALMQGLADATEAGAKAGDAGCLRALPGVWSALARGEAAARLLADVPLDRASMPHHVTIDTTAAQTHIRCCCGQTLVTDAVPCSTVWLGLVRGFVGAHGGGQ